MGIIFDYIFWTVTWCGITGLVRYVAEIPPSLQKIDNVKLQRKQYYQYFTNLVSLIHAFYALAICRIDIIAGGYCILFEPHQWNRPLTVLEFQLINSSFCYFIVDTAVGFIGGYNDFWMNVHHAVMFTSYLNTYYK